VEWAQWGTQFECYILATRKAEKNEDVLVLPILSTLSIITVHTYSKKRMRIPMTPSSGFQLTAI
jgi:hypothetical protein